MKNDIAIFEEHQIWRYIHENTEMVTQCNRLRNQTGELVTVCHRLKIEAGESVTNCNQLKMEAGSYLATKTLKLLDKK
jgi:hypothetical protein